MVPALVFSSTWGLAAAAIRALPAKGDGKKDFFMGVLV
jgi:hypothetical protein